MLTIFSELFVVYRALSYGNIRMWQRWFKHQSPSQFSVSIEFDEISQRFGCNSQVTQLFNYKTEAITSQMNSSNLHDKHVYLQQILKRHTKTENYKLQSSMRAALYIDHIIPKVNGSTVVQQYTFQTLAIWKIWTSMTRIFILMFFIFIFILWGGTRFLRMPVLRPASQASPMRNPREGTCVVLRDTIRLTWWCVLCVVVAQPLIIEVCRAKGMIGSGETLCHDIYRDRPITTVLCRLIPTAWWTATAHAHHGPRGPV